MEPRWRKCMFHGGSADGKTLKVDTNCEVWRVEVVKPKTSIVPGLKNVVYVEEYRRFEKRNMYRRWYEYRIAE